MSPQRDRITLETPDNITLQFPLATFGQRAVAYIVDTIIYALIITVLIFISIWLLSNSSVISFLAKLKISTKDVGIILISIIGFLFVTDAYFVLQEFYNKGQTIGKKLMKIRVLRLDGRHITLREALIRGLSRIIIDTFPGSFMVGFVSYFCTANQQRVGDLIADTVVVNEEFHSKIKPHAFLDEIEAKPLVKTSDRDIAIRNLLTIYLLKARKMSLAHRNEYSRLILDKIGLDKRENLTDNENQIYNYLKENYV